MTSRRAVEADGWNADCLAEEPWRLMTGMQSALAEDPWPLMAGMQK